MGKRLAILILAFFISVAAFGAGTARPRPSERGGARNLLADGFVLAGVDGKLTSPDDNEKWFFEFDSDLSDGIGRICTGESLELLLSSTLEKMTADVKKHPEAGYRLWGRIAKYNGKNFIFPIYFLPISKTSKLASQTSKESQQQTRPTINEPNDALVIPEQIIAKLTTRRIVRPEQLLKGLELKTDCILADRTGFIARQDNGAALFVFDALGRNIQRQISLPLLPCEILERAKRLSQAEPDPLRFKVAGIVTEYKGEYYLLLQRAIRVYSHGNFAG